MADARKTVKSTCLCGSIRHEITLPTSDYPLPTDICHCTSCRHGSGTLCTTVTRLPESYQPQPGLIAKLHSFEFSKAVTQYQCANCGSVMLFASHKADRQVYGLVSGTLDLVEGIIEIKAHEYITDTLDGGFSDFLTTINDKIIPRWPQAVGKGEQLPLHWHAERDDNVAATASDRLHAHCKCKGVQFWIAKPSERSRLGTAAWPDLIVPFNSDKPAPPPECWWIQAGGKKHLAGVCACDSCRLAAGNEWVQWAFVPTIDISLDAEGKVPFSRDFGTLKAYRSSFVATRHFCGVCSANVFWDGDERPQLIDVAVGLLDASEGSRAESWLEWRTARLSYREDAMPRAKSLTLGVEAGLRDYGHRVQGAPLEGGG